MIIHSYFLIESSLSPLTDLSQKRVFRSEQREREVLHVIERFCDSRTWVQVDSELTRYAWMTVEIIAPRHNYDAR